VLEEYLPSRAGVVLQQFGALGLVAPVGAPRFLVDGTESRGGGVRAGSALTFGATAGRVVYTLDGSDPRAPGGGLAPSALVLVPGVDAPLTLDRDLTVTARLQDGGAWSAVDAASFRVVPPAAAGNLAVSEIDYNPHAPDPARGETNPDSNEYEFIELRNVGTTAVSLAGVRFTQGVTFDFTTGAVGTLEPGQYVVVVRNVDAFRSRYGTTPLVAGAYAGRLDNGGEVLTLVDFAGATMASFAYDDVAPWPVDADGWGRSLVFAGGAVNPGDPAAWRASAEVGGSPGRAGNTPPALVVAAAVETDEDVPLAPLTLGLSDFETPAAGVVVRIESDNPLLVPAANVVLSGSGAVRTLAINPLPDASGTARIRLIVEDGDGATATQEVTVTVRPVNDAPLLDPVAPVRVPEGSAVEVPLTALDRETPASGLRYSLEDEAPAGATLDPVSGLLRWTADDGPRTATFRVRVDDDGLPTASGWRVVTIEVENIAPTFDPATTPSEVDLTLGDRLARRFVAIDPGRDLSSASFDPGDGGGFRPVPLGADGTIVLDHLYSASGTFAAGVRVEDRDGAGAESTFAVTVRPAPDRTPPRLVGQALVRSGREVRRIRLVFSEPIDPARATRTAAFTLTAAGADGRLGTRDDFRIRLRSAVYETAARAVVLTAAQPLRRRTRHRLVVNGTSLRVGIADLAGNRLDGDRDGRAGGDAVRDFSVR
jgi:hypothetical protein